MPDRAVVDDEYTMQPCTCTVHGSNRPCPQHGMFNRLPSPTDEEWDRQRKRQTTQPQPRALVALSEDRQWLVVLGKDEWFWTVLEKEPGQYKFRQIVTDTGQDAHAVLEQFLKERDHA